MPTHSLIIEIFTAPSCSRCDKAFQLAKRVLTELSEEYPENNFLKNDAIELRKLSVVEELDYAVELGVRTTPSIALNGKLLFIAMPRDADFRKAVLSHINAEHEDKT